MILKILKNDLSYEEWEKELEPYEFTRCSNSYQKK
jgi:hypothetical protein